MHTNNLMWLNENESKEILHRFLMDVNDDIVPRLSERVDIMKYAEKLSEHAKNLIVLSDDCVVASASIYVNTSVAFISSIAVKRCLQGNGIGKMLLQQIEIKAKESNCEKIQLKVHYDNRRAVSFYRKNSYVDKICDNNWITMEKNI